LTPPGTGTTPRPPTVSPLRWIIASVAGGAVGWLATLGLAWTTAFGFVSAPVGLTVGTLVAGLVIGARTPSRWILAGVVTFVTFIGIVYTLVIVTILSGAFVIPS
jgi:hypothetical protein